MRWNYLLLITSLSTVSHLPSDLSNSCRSFCIATAAPLWQKVAYAREERITPENSALRAQIDLLQEYSQEEASLAALLRDYSLASKEGLNTEERRHRLQYTQELLALRYQAALAQVIFREPSNWHRTFWINLGEKDNQALGKQLIGPNSPVLVDRSLAGVVEYVGDTQSRVRLITDADLAIASRIARGGIPCREILYHVRALSTYLNAASETFFSQEEHTLLLHWLSGLEKQFASVSQESFGAKGLLTGLCDGNVFLKGEGFQYNTPDEMSALNPTKSFLPLIKPGDLIVTSGLDGVFPLGIPIAVVTKVFPMKAANSFDLEAKAIAALQDVQQVLVLPPLERREKRRHPVSQ